MQLARRVRRFLLDNAKGIYRVFLDRIAIRLFIRPDLAVSSAFKRISPAASEKLIATALCSATAAEPSTPGKVVAAYCQGLLLMGRDRTEDLDWRLLPERAVITADSAHIPKRTQGYMRRGEFEIRRNQDFEGVVRACKRQRWSWITDRLVEIYLKVYEAGFGLSFEAYKDGELVGGNWGFVVGDTYSIMSMFHEADRAGTVTFGFLTQALIDGEFGMLDCGEQQPHFARFGAQPIPRHEFVERVAQGLRRSA